MPSRNGVKSKAVALSKPVQQAQWCRCTLSFPVTTMTQIPKEPGLCPPALQGCFLACLPFPEAAGGNLCLGTSPVPPAATTPFLEQGERQKPSCVDMQLAQCWSSSPVGNSFVPAELGPPSAAGLDQESASMCDLHPHFSCARCFGLFTIAATIIQVMENKPFLDGRTPSSLQPVPATYKYLPGLSDTAWR